ncbi:helix-turn-helix domain-containing protein [Deinococcus roseus]|uniref:helix-turn-helix domain-containing protein n=1 Tax=Deinococcus roseus TaxID=392414 RepID=UPI0016662A9C|nr:helix-turn-helix domain-containing protein [Deinococcus roseus]
MHFRAPLEHGAPYLLDALREGLPALVWFEISEREHGDAVAQANKLAEAFNHTLGQNIIDYGVTPPYITIILQRYDALFDRYCFVYSGNQVLPGMLELFQHMLALGHQVVVLGEMNLPDAQVVSAQELMLEPEEALQLASLTFQLPEATVQAIYQKSQGIFEKFWVEVHLQKGWSIPHQPCAAGRRVPRGFEVEIKPEFLLPLLLKKEKHLEALELAAEALPEKVLDFLEQSASRVILQGEHVRLWQVLNRLPPELLAHEAVMRWRLEAAYLMDRHVGLREEVLSCLQQHEAPELRALAANLWFFGMGEDSFAEASRAVQHKRSSLTVQALARAFRWQIRELRDIQHYVDLSFEALRLAEADKNTLQIIRASVHLPYCLLLNNQLQEAAHWANWTMQFLNALPVVNAVDRLLTLNAWYYLRILTGDHVGLEGGLQDALKLSRNTSESLHYLLHCTWSEYCLIVGQPSQALEHWLEIWSSYNRHERGRFAYYLVRLCMALGQEKEAEQYAREALALSADAPLWKRRYAHLALALSVLHSRPQEALQHLNSVENIGPFKYSERVWVAAPLLKKIIQEDPPVQNEDTNEAEEQYIRALSLYERLEYVGSFHLLRENESEPPSSDLLYIKTLGSQEVSLAGEVLDLSPRQVEIVVLLALHPQGLTGEQLLLELYGDAGTYSNLKALISRLRRIVPIVSQPYKLQLEYRADFLELQERIRQGRMEQVVRLYAGGFMEHSTAPGIESMRNELERQVKALAENSRDPDFVLKLAEKLEDDLDIWEHLSHILPRQSQHYAFVLAQVKRLREEWGVV